MARYKLQPATDRTPKQVVFEGELSPKEVSTILCCDPRTLMRWRNARKGIAFYKRGKNILYPVEAVNKYLSDSFCRVA
ncbi:MAG: helix-turn-helix domain-containing protein [Rickettsiales bacterium]|jgi:hypothetical protein|nr:helix-turn-helix domain-containing protein [Rickettsiales bacterium]